MGHALLRLSHLDPRYLIPATPALLYFLYKGWVTTEALVTTTMVSPRILPRLVMSGLAIALLFSTLSSWPGTLVTRGWRQLAAESHQWKQSKVVMVSGFDEGAFVTELAINDKSRHVNPTWTVLRGSKMLSSSTWMGADYRLRFLSENEVLASLKKWGVSLVAIDVARPLLPHENQLLAALNHQKSQWKERPGPANGVRIFVEESATFGEAIEVDLQQTIGRKLKLVPNPPAQIRDNNSGLLKGIWFR